MMNNLCTTFSPFYSFNLQHSSYKHFFSIKVEISVDPGQMVSSEARLYGSSVLSKKKKINTGSKTQGLIHIRLLMKV